MSVAAVVIAMVSGRDLPASDYDVSISEIHYNPADLPTGEFIELHNRSDAPVDVSGWFLLGGIQFIFPPEVSIGPRARLVVAKNELTLRHSFGVENVVGDFDGRLGDNGDRFDLRNAEGQLIDRVAYDDNAGWDSDADGRGPSLERVQPLEDGTQPQFWRASRTVGGTPGVENSRGSGPMATTLIGPSHEWAYRKGTQAPSSPPTAWTGRLFDDSSWSRGASGFGYAREGVSTVLDDMQGSYSTLYLRARFSIDRPDRVRALVLIMRYEDGYIAYLNGREIGRSETAGPDGTSLDFDDTATRVHEADSVLELLELSDVPWLISGENVLAIHALNVLRNSSGFVIQPTLRVTVDDVSADEQDVPDVEINEVHHGMTPEESFVELFNEDDRTADLAGYRLRVAPDPESAYEFPAGTTLAPGELLVVTGDEIPFEVDGAVQPWIGLLTPDDHYVDSLRLRVSPAGASIGRFPDGDGDTFVLGSPTPGEANTSDVEDRIVINEIRYHPPLGQDDEEFIELFNRGDDDVDLAGWRLTGAVQYSFGRTTTLRAGAYLVIARDPVAVGTRYSIAGVRGPWDGRLSDGAEKIQLVDSLSNRVDVVRYADDGRWPNSPGQTGADGGGASIELIHPGTENNAGAAWRASSGSGSAGRRNRAYLENPAPVFRSPSHFPPSPRSSDAVVVSARVTDESGLRWVNARFRNDGAGSYWSRRMYDDGLHDDGLAGDGRFAVALPSRPDETIVEFYFEAVDGTGLTSTMPFDAPLSSFLYQVDDVDYLESLPLHRVVLRDADFQELVTRDLFNDDLLDGTLIVGNKILYNIGVRYRGENSRRFWRKPFRLQLSDDERLDGRDRLNLAVLDADIGHIAQSFLRRADIPIFQSTLLALTVNKNFQSSHGGIYHRLEAYDNTFLDRQFPGDDDGNLYRGRDLGGGAQADLVYRGSVAVSYRAVYEKETNIELDDYSDVIELTDVLTNTTDSRYLERVSELLEVDEWLRVFASQMILSNQDGSIATNAGEDYFIYRRPSSGRWVLLIWDQAEGFQRPDSGIFRMSSPSVQRLVTHPSLIRRYLQIMRSMLDGPFSVAEMTPRLDLLRQYFDDVGIDELRRFVVDRHDAMRRLLPEKLTVGVEPTFFVRSGDLWRYFLGTRDPPPNWTQPNFDDSRWAQGCGGFGFGDGDDCTNLEEEMGGFLTTIFIRHEFQLDDPNSVNDLTLSVRYDDGYVFFLNGEEIHRQNFTGEVAYDSRADHTEEAEEVEVFDVRESRDLLVRGTNVIAVVALNSVAFSDDLTIDPQLYTSPRFATCSDELLIDGSRITLGGTAPSASTVAVRIDGRPTIYERQTGRWHTEIDVLRDDQISVVSAVDEVGSVIALESVNLLSSRSPTHVSGALPTTRWTALRSPYVVSGEVTVASGRTLTIDAGVTVLFEPGSSIVVRGTLTAHGTASQKVRFHATDCATYWGGILFEGGIARGVLTHCEIQRAVGIGDHHVGRRAALLVTLSARLVLESCVVSEIDGWAVIADGTWSELRVLDSTLEDTFGGILSDSGFAHIERTTISRFAGGGHGIEMVSASSPRSVIRNSIVEDGDGDGIRLSGSNTWIAGTTVRRLAGSGIALSGSSGAYIETTLIHQCANGISIGGGARPRCRRVTLARNGIGVQLHAGTDDSRVSGIVLDSSIVWGNREELWFEGQPSSDITYTNVSGGFPGEGNTDFSPMFVNVAAADFRLREASPSRGAGRDGEDQGAFGNDTPIDGSFLRGDANSDGSADISDAVKILGYLFWGDTPSRCLDALDVDDNAAIELTDAVYLLTFLYRTGNQPAAPYPLRGVDPTPDDPFPCG